MSRLRWLPVCWIVFLTKQIHVFCQNHFKGWCCCNQIHFWLNLDRKSCSTGCIYSGHHMFIASINCFTRCCTSVSYVDIHGLHSILNRAVGLAAARRSECSCGHSRWNVRAPCVYGDTIVGWAWRGWSWHAGRNPRRINQFIWCFRGTLSTTAHPMKRNCAKLVRGLLYVQLDLLQQIWPFCWQYEFWNSRNIWFQVFNANIQVPANDSSVDFLYQRCWFACLACNAGQRWNGKMCPVSIYVLFVFVNLAVSFDMTGLVIRAGLWRWAKTEIIAYDWLPQICLAVKHNSQLTSSWYSNPRFPWSGRHNLCVFVLDI